MEQKTLIAASCTNDLHTRETFFPVATFEVLWLFSSQTEYKTCIGLSFVQVFLGFPEKRRPYEYCL